MNNLLVEKLTPTAKLPTRTHHNDAGLDLYADMDCIIKPGQNMVISTGLRIVFPHGCAGLIWDKSGISLKCIHTLGGVIDADYRGEYFVNLINLGQVDYDVKQGQKIAQLLIQKVELLEVVETKITDLDQVSRGEKAFGSSGLL